MVNAEGQLSLTTRTVRGAGWIVCWRVATRLLGTFSTLFLVRMLAPADFGLVALGTAFSQALDGLSEIGVGNALVREHEIDRGLYDTGFTLRSSEASPRHASSPAARGRSRASSANRGWPASCWLLRPPCSSARLRISASVDFQRDLAFEKEFGLYLAPRILGIVACLTAAYVWRSYWALVVGILTTRSIEMLCSYLMHSYRPRLSLRAWRQIVGFSFWSWMLAMGLPDQGQDRQLRDRPAARAQPRSVCIPSPGTSDS